MKGISPIRKLRHKFLTKILSHNLQIFFKDTDYGDTIYDQIQNEFL